MSSSATTEAGGAAATAAGPPVEENLHPQQLPPVAENGPGWVQESQSAAERNDAQDVRMLLVMLLLIYVSGAYCGTCMVFCK